MAKQIGLKQNEAEEDLCRTVKVLRRMGVMIADIQHQVVEADADLGEQIKQGLCRIGDIDPETGGRGDTRYVITVRFDRYREDGEDTYARLAGGYVAQVKAELDQNPALQDKYTVLRNRLDETVSYVWCQFTWIGSGQDFVKTLQNTYDEYGMAGHWRILEAFEGPEGGLMPFIEKAHGLILEGMHGH